VTAAETGGPPASLPPTRLGEPATVLARTIAGNRFRFDPVIAVLGALLAGFVALAAVGVDPFAAYRALLGGAFGSSAALSATLVQMTPLLLVGLALGLSFESGFFNIGAGGQYGVGALAAGLVGGFVHLPGAAELAAMAAAAVAAGAIWALLPAVLRAFTGASEIITTLMLSYVAADLIDYVVTGPGGSGGVVNQTPALRGNALFPPLAAQTQLTAAVVVAVALVPVMWFVLRRTAFGYRLRMVGKNPQVAQAAGISVRRTAVVSLTASGGIAGLGGMLEVASVTLAVPQNFSIQVGFTAIAVALLARNQPFGILVASFLLGGLAAGATPMEAQVGVSGPFVTFLEAIIIATVAGMPLARRALRSLRSRRPAGRRP
jgi:ABC-type uncharacterized transport system permease subunit